MDNRGSDNLGSTVYILDQPGIDNTEFMNFREVAFSQLHTYLTAKGVFT